MRKQFMFDFVIWGLVFIGALTFDLIWARGNVGFGKWQGLVVLISGIQAARYLYYVASYGRKWVDAK